MSPTTFHASFLLAVPFLKDVPKEKKKKAKREPKKKKKKSDRDEEVERIKDKIVEEEKPFTGQMEVGKPIAFVHVEYTIIPDILIYDFDVVCYGDVAKIYTRDSNTSVKTTVKGNVAWIAFSLDHSIHMSDELLVDLHSTTVAFNVWNDKKKQFKTTQDDKPKKFTMLDEDVEKAKAGTLSTMFVALKECDSYGYIINEDVNLPSLSVLVSNSLRAIPYPCHSKSFETVVKQLSDGLQITQHEGGENKKNKKGTKDKTVQEAENSEESEYEGKGKRGKKGGKDKKGKNSALAGSQQLTMLGEIFFANITDTKIEKKMGFQTISYMAVQFTVVDLFVGDQLNYFNPAVIHIKDINNIPVKLFQKYGFDEIFLTYSLPNDKEYVTAHKQVDEVVSFNDIRVMLTHELDATHVMEFILTQFLCVKLWGVRGERYCEPQVPHELFRLHESNRCMLSRLLPDPFSHPFSKTDSEAVRFVKDKTSNTVCLAEMEMDISALASNQLLIECTNNLRRPRCSHEYGATSGSWVYFNVPDMHEPARLEPVNASPFTDFLLQMTTLDVTFKMLSPLTSVMMGVYASKEHYNRLVVVITGPLKGNLCTDIVEEIYKNNHHYVRELKPPNDLFYARKEFLRPHIGEYSEKITEELRGKQHFYLARQSMFRTPIYARSALTGFILDNGDRVLIVLEGRARSSLLKFYCFLEDLDVSSRFIVHYNSDLAFKTRLYHDFLEMGGVMVITMDEPIEVKQMRKEFLLSRSTAAPSRAVQTINKLNNLFSVKDIATACRQDFFPSAMHLVSFATEFGVPFRLIDGYTLPSTPLQDSPAPTSNEEDLLPSTIDGDYERRRSENRSFGFDLTDFSYKVDIFGRSCPTGYTLVHACSSTNASNISTATIISEIQIPAVNAMAAVYNPATKSSQTESLTEKIPQADGDSLSVAKDTGKAAKARTKQDVDSKRKGETDTIQRPKNPTKGSKIVDPLSIIPVIPADQQQNKKILESLPSLLLPRKHLQGTYSNYSSEAGAPSDQSQTLPQRQESYLGLNCPIQERYFKDFLSVSNVTPHKTVKRKDKRKAERPKVRVKDKSPPHKELRDSSVFPSEVFKKVSLKVVDSRHSVKQRRRHSRPPPPQKRPSTTPPETMCPLQEYFENYYE